MCECAVAVAAPPCVVSLSAADAVANAEVAVSSMPSQRLGVQTTLIHVNQENINLLTKIQI